MAKDEQLCPACGEPAGPRDTVCRHCDEPLGGKKGLSTGALIGLIVGGTCLLATCGIAVVAAIAIPNLIEARKHGNEAAAVGALKTINTAQSLFREGDKEEDGNFDYGSLQELSDSTLIDGVLGSGTKQGYLFRCQPAPETPEFLWMATATPAVPTKTGDRYFATDHAGVVYYRTDRPFEMKPETAIEPDGTTVLPVGRSPRRRRPR